MRIDIERKTLPVLTGALVAIAALTLAAPPAMANPVIPVPPPPPLPAEEVPAQAAAPPAMANPVIPVPPPPPVPAEEVPAQAAAPPAMANPVIPPLPAEEVPAQAAAADAAPPAEGVPHLASPENLPPGTSDDPVGPPQGRGLAYLRDLWHAVQTQEVSGGDALLLLTQRPLDPNAAPPPGVAPGPQPPLPPEPAP